MVRLARCGLRIYGLKCSCNIDKLEKNGRYLQTLTKLILTDRLTARMVARVFSLEIVGNRSGQKCLFRPVMFLSGSAGAPRPCRNYVNA